MQEYSIQRSTRRCHFTDRAFEPGESYYSAVIQQGSDLVRWDVGREQWNGPPEGTIGWWKSIAPEKSKGKQVPAPVAVLIDSLASLVDDPQQTELAYLLALLLVRRRVLTFTNDDSNEDLDNLEREGVLHLTHSATNRDFVIPICQPTPDRSASLTDELRQLLYCDA